MLMVCWLHEKMSEGVSLGWGCITKIFKYSLVIIFVRIPGQLQSTVVYTITLSENSFFGHIYLYVQTAQSVYTLSTSSLFTDCV